MTAVLTWALPLAPAVAAFAGFLVPLRAKRTAAVLGVAGPGAAALAVVLLACTGLPAGGDHPAAIGSTGPDLVRFGDVAVTLSTGVTALTWWVAALVALVAVLVQVYSIGYLSRHDDRYAPYAAQISLFTAAMMLVVVSDDLVLMLIGWEVMGACSYLLIGHDRRLPAAPAAAVKAFLVTRVGDVGFLLGILLLGFHAGGFRVEQVTAYATGEGSTAVVTAAALLIMFGAIGKSAQFPLHTWLPDAMAGPTPISALIHAATMVAAGAYVLVRLTPVLGAAGVRPVLAGVAVVTMLLAACAALAADDLKRVLAWSTVSQVAYMMTAAAAGAPEAALYYLVAHGLFKALLFLAAGAVIHMAGTNSMSGMGGLRRGAPVTFWTMTIAFAGLVGLPPLVGFWAKEHVLTAAFDGGHTVLFAAGVLTALLTAAYATRAWLRTFFGDARDAARRPAAHDPGGLMRWPLVVLALPTLLLGAVFAVTGGPLAHGSADLIVLLAALAAAAAGIAGTYAIWRTDPAADPARALGPLRTPFTRAFYLDEAQALLVVRPIRALARLARRADTSLVDGAAEGTGRGVGLLGGLIAATHRPGMPRHVLSVLGGALLIGAAVVAVGVWT